MNFKNICLYETVKVTVLARITCISVPTIYSINNFNTMKTNKFFLILYSDPIDMNRV